MPPQVQLMSKQRRNLYGGEICNLERSLQDSLNAWILKHIIHIEELA